MKLVFQVHLVLFDVSSAMVESLKKAWDFLLRSDNALGFPLIHVVAPLAIIAVILISVCLILCCRTLCCDKEVHVMPNSRRRRRTVALDDGEVVGPSRTTQHETISSSHGEVTTKLDPEVVNKINAVYEKRNYVSLRRAE